MYKGSESVGESSCNQNIQYDLEVCSGEKCAGYRGHQSKTKSGVACLRWDSIQFYGEQ